MVACRRVSDTLGSFRNDSKVEVEVLRRWGSIGEPPEVNKLQAWTLRQNVSRFGVSLSSTCGGASPWGR
jgi:hypothetical protein